VLKTIASWFRRPAKVGRYAPDELAAVRSAQAERNKRRAVARMLADYYNPCVTDAQMYLRHGDIK
jgi:hypothetical protein